MKALVIGGGNGIGLAIVKALLADGYQVIILDKCPPPVDAFGFSFPPIELEDVIPPTIYEYCNLLQLDEKQIAAYAADPEIKVLMITAGFGRIADFEYFHTAEIRNMFMVNATATIEILRIFYDRIKGDDDFYCGVMGSIAGLMSSPSASVYAASKAAICRFIESVNIELEAAAADRFPKDILEDGEDAWVMGNRILNISPGTIKGTRFYGGENQLDALEDLADEILNHLYAKETLFIPQYEAVFKDVLERYHEDPHEYGLYSYDYKKKSGRLDNHKRVVIGFLSGTFDLFHVGHVNLLRRAKQQCDYLIVGVHDSGAWKGKETFIPFEERKQMIASCRYVDQVVDADVEDTDAWEKWHYDRLFVGSDYKGSERFNRYEEFFKDKEVQIIYFPYTQGTSSTQIRQALEDIM